MPLFGPPNIDRMKNKRNVKGLIKALNYTEDNNVREAAARALGEIGDNRAVEPLITVLNDRDWQKRKENKPVRQAAAWALGRIGDPQAIEPLVEALLDYKMEISAPASEALIEIGDPSAVKPIMDLMDTMMSLNIPDHGAKVLLSLGSSAVEPLIPFLNNQNTDRRYVATDILGKIEDPRAVDPLIKTLKDEKEHVRTNAARSLGNIGDARAVDPLILALQDDWKDLRFYAARSLGKIGDPRAIDALVEIINQSRGSESDEATSSLGKIGGPRAIKALVEALDMRFPKKIIDTLVLIGNPAVEALSIALQDDRDKIVEGATEALERIGTPKAKEALAHNKN